MSDQLARHAVAATHEVAKALESAQTDCEWHEAEKKVAHAKSMATKLGKRGVQDMQSGEHMLKKAHNDIAKALSRAEIAKQDAADAALRAQKARDDGLSAANALRKAQNDEATAMSIGRKGQKDKVAADKIMDAVVKAEVAFHEEDLRRRKALDDKQRKEAEELERAANVRRQQREKEAHDLWSRQERGKGMSSLFKSAGHQMCKCD